MNKILLVIIGVFFNIMAPKTQAVEFGRIVELKGEGFISHEGKTRAMKKGDIIKMDSDIVIEHKGYATLTDNADHSFHLGNATSVHVSAQCLEFRSGDLWIQSSNKSVSHKIQTSNALINYEAGEAIVSYDPVKGKTQLMVINNMMKLSNLNMPELNLSVSEGNFSFVDNTHDEGAPRNPTPVGNKTYTQLMALFNGIKPMDKNSAILFKNEAKVEEHKTENSRTLASVSEHSHEKTNTAEEKKNEIDSKIMDDYKESVLVKSESKKNVSNTGHGATIHSKKKIKAKVVQLEVVHIYGQTSVPTVAIGDEVPSLPRKRAPASVVENNAPATSEISTKASPYSNDDKDKESNKLINDLKKLE
jgi:hypothetical protein